MTTPPPEIRTAEPDAEMALSAAALTMLAGFSAFVPGAFLLFIGVATCLVLRLMLRPEGDPDLPPIRCRRCRHLLRGLVEPRCPECGLACDPRVPALYPADGTIAALERAAALRRRRPALSYFAPPPGRPLDATCLFAREPEPTTEPTPPATPVTTVAPRPEPDRIAPLDQRPPRLPDPEPPRLRAWWIAAGGTSLVATIVTANPFVGGLIAAVSALVLGLLDEDVVRSITGALLGSLVPTVVIVPVVALVTGTGYPAGRPVEVVIILGISTIACPVLLGIVMLVPGVIGAAITERGGDPPAPRPLTACPRCGYALYGLPEPRCPECGTRF